MDTFVTHPIVDRLSKRLAREVPGIDADDVAQEMNLELHRQWDTIKAKPRDEWPGLVNYVAARAGRDYAKRERQLYQNGTAEWVYTPAEVRELFSEHYFDDNAWLDAPKRPEAGEQTLLGDGISVALWDLQLAFNAASEVDQSVILRAYASHEALDAAGRKRLQRAIDRVAELMNNSVSQRFNHSDHDGPGSRHAISNAHARVITGDYYEG